MANTVGKISGQMLENNLLRRDMQTGDENLSFETDLIFLDVFNNRVGIKTDTPFRPLLVNGFLNSTNFIVDTALTVPDFTISSNSIDLGSGNIELSATGLGAEIRSTGIQAGNIQFDQNVLSNISLNQDINLNPSGSGTVNFYNELKVNGSLHATGDIIADGNIVIGSDDTDNIIFNTQIGSDIVPDIADTYNIGKFGQQFDTLYTYLVNGQNVASGGAVVGGIDLSIRPGNTWYVSATNGNNTNVGDHPNGPFATIEWALSQATSGDTVYIYAGLYVELFPLVVPEGVTVKGEGVRSVKIVPDTASTHEDVFKLNGQTTVEDLTIADFYYDNILDKGYAFSFDSGFSVTSRSPYIRNVTVITKGSVTSGTDPRGFDQADAGRGAKIDGSTALSTSIEASLLFHSVTFITPGVDCIVMKNGVRVEWLNSFIYFADRGLYAENGSAGFASLGLKYGAEIRSIGSANVYGNYGAYADGDEVLMYLISHNFGYIGSGKDSSNDPTNVIQANEIIRLNDGKIYFQSMDHVGDFRVGDIFRIESSTGNIEFQTSVVTNSSINLTDGVNSTFIDATEVLTGNIKISDNTIESITQNIILNSFNNVINITSNFDVGTDLYLGNNLTVAGSANLGSSTSNFVEINSTINSDVIPSTTNFNIGDTVNFWNNLYSSSLLFDNIAIYNNVIETRISNSDLELRSNGTGNVVFENDLVVAQNVNFQGSVNFNEISLNTLTSNNLIVDNLITFNTETVFDDIEFLGNRITTVVSNADLELAANGSGSVVIPSDSLVIDQNLTVNGTTFLKDTNVLGNVVTSNIFSTNYASSELIGDTISVQGNVIQTTVSNADLELRANGTGNVVITDSLILSQNLSVNGLASFLNVTSNTLDLYSNTIATTITSDFFDNGQILIDDNFIATTQSNTNLELRANNLGGVLFDQVLKVTDSTISNILVSGTEFEKSINFTPYAGYQFNINSTGALKLPIGNNTNRVLSSNGEIRYNNLNGSFEGRLTGGTKSISGLYDLDRNTYITAELTPGANDNTIRMYTNGIVTGTVNSTQVQFSAIAVDEIRLNDNKFRTINSNADIELRPSGTGLINIKNNITIEPSVITNTVNNAVTEIRSTGTGYVKFADTFGLRIPYGTDAERPVGIPVGSTRYNTDQSYLEVWDGSAWVTAAGGGPTVSNLVMEDLSDTYALIFG
jgi:hypothetical protein